MRRSVTTSPSPAKAWGLPMALYLAGIFMGAIDTGIVTPARTVIQTQLHVDEQTGIWLITAYTLAYAAAIPVMGKLADRNGRRTVYLVSIALFGVGSLLCGLSQDVGSFEMLIAARALQAIGGGGILPIATADVGTSVPEEKRGMALGLVGAVYGIANVFGASAGSLVLDVVGTENWQWIFYINVPIALLILVLGWFALPNRRADQVAPIDVWGSVVLVAMILSLLWGLKNLDFFNLVPSLSSLEVWPWLAAFLLLVPVLIVVERFAADPVLNLGYFTNRGIALTLLLSLLSGFVLMGVVFVPQFAENVLRLPTGTGGYLVIVLGLASGVGAPLSGKLTDAHGPRLVLALGFGLSLLAGLVIIFWAIPSPGVVSAVTALVVIGLGLGFVVGSPLNYMMLQRVPDAESSSALGTLSLVRAVGTTVAPAVLVGFLANVGPVAQDAVTAELPTTVSVPALPHAAELKTTIQKWKADPDLAERMGDLDVDTSMLDRTEIDLESMRGGNASLPDDLVELLRTADATTIVERSEIIAERMFADQTPTRVAEITDGVQKGIDGLSTAADEMAKADTEMTSSLDEMDTGLVKMSSGMEEMDAQRAEMRAGLRDLDAKLAEMDRGLAEMKSQADEMGTGLAKMDEGLAGMDSGIAGLTKARDGANQGVDGISRGLAEQRAALAAAQNGMAQAADGMPQAAADGMPQAPHAASAVSHPSGAPTESGEQVSPTSTPAAGPSSAATTAPLTPSTAPSSGRTASATPSSTSTASSVPTTSAVPPSAGPSAAAPSRPAVPPAGAMEQLAALETSISETEQKLAATVAQRDQVVSELATLQSQRDELAAQREKLATGRQELIKARAELQQGRQGAAQGRAELNTGYTELTKARDELVASREELQTGRADLEAGREKLRAQRDEVLQARTQMIELKDAVPGSFEQAKRAYLADLGANAPAIERAFQTSVNQGFRDLYLFFSGTCLLSMVALALVGRGPTKPEETTPEESKPA